MAKNYLRLDKVGGQDHYESFVAEHKIVNGQWLNLGEMDLDLGIEMAKAKKAEEGKEPDTLACTVFINYGELNYDETAQELPVGKAGRALHHKKGNIVSFNVENAQGLVAGDLVTVGADGLGVKKATGDDHVVGQVIRLDYLAYVGDLVVVRIK
ncbi:hypothetical protein [Vagococcus fluvialis]|uniref:hypothetical protein n=1 Tax=Vagococcus fluvialis TaxID=2738 RepID=UPI001D0BD04A|nr:hypothetical protein [Vagococcus fluvialis]UDM72746.1 hypothetical protein K5L00_14405 [Vagococcus fluvialis]UDM78468.1 hypothetical protein K5K98_14610 [Vagococcus fluvialis]UDM84021.1 hypothetical protein K5K96_14430 [Vagococcus fluvialis]